MLHSLFFCVLDPTCMGYFDLSSLFSFFSPHPIFVLDVYLPLILLILVPWILFGPSLSIG